MVKSLTVTVSSVTVKDLTPQPPDPSTSLTRIKPGFLYFVFSSAFYIAIQRQITGANGA